MIKEANMVQISIHLDTESEAKARNYSEMMNISLDQWIADLIREKTTAAWPKSIKNLAGSWSDFPTLEEIRADMRIDTDCEET